MVHLRNLDAFAKTRPDLKQQSAVGGIITLVAGTTAGLLFIGQLLLYIFGTTTHSLQLSQSIPIPLLPLENTNNYNKYQQRLDTSGKIPLKLHITFPHVTCNKLDVIHDGASLQSGELEKIHGKHTLIFQQPTKSELIKALGGQKPTSSNTNTGCTITGTLRPAIVAGTLSICLSRQAWAVATTSLSMGFGENLSTTMQDALKQYNVSHYVHNIQFGTQFTKQTHKPLQNVQHVIDNDFFGIAVSQMQVKLVPTIHQGMFVNDYVYQTSVVDIIIQPQTLVAQGAQQLPGLTISYDFIPLTVLHSEGRDNFLIFTSSLISIVGGVFVTVGMLTGCLVHSAKAVAKKID